MCDIERTSIGAGISSSAALEYGVAKGLNDLFDLTLSDLELIKISRVAEHNFVGAKCGVMDQFAVTMGKRNKLLLFNCEMGSVFKKHSRVLQ